MKHSKVMGLTLHAGTVILSLLLSSCSSSSTVRYDRDKEKKEEKSEEKTAQKYKEEFNIVPYRTNIDIKEKENSAEVTPDLNPWYGFEQKDTSSVEAKTISGTTNGFRVQVRATDNLEEADSLKSELTLKVTNKGIYVIFDPPFYKVEVGDFVSMNEARNLNFKLNQMGYTESRVIASTINIFE